jgi:hypothetical protein
MFRFWGHPRRLWKPQAGEKERLFMLLSVIIQVKIRGFLLLLLHMLILRSPRVVMKKN